MTNELVAASIDVLDVASAEPTSAAGTSTSFATALNATKSGEADGSSVFQNVRELLSWAAKGLALVVGSALVLASAVPSPGSAARSSAWRAPVVGYLLFSGGFARAAAARFNNNGSPSASAGHTVAKSADGALSHAAFPELGSLALADGRRRLSYSQIAKMTAADAAADDRFGRSVAIAGDTVVVGAFGDDDGGSSSGSVYVFRTSDGGATYDQVAKLTAADAAADDYFGYSVAIDGATVVIGAYGDDDGGSSSGSVYVFRSVDSLYFLCSVVDSFHE